MTTNGNLHIFQLWDQYRDEWLLNLNNKQSKENWTKQQHGIKAASARRATQTRIWLPLAINQQFINKQEAKHLNYYTLASNTEIAVWESTVRQQRIFATHFTGRLYNFRFMRQ